MHVVIAAHAGSYNCTQCSRENVRKCGLLSVHATYTMPRAS